MADAKPEEIKELLGGALFKALYKWMIDSGPVYLLPTGERRASSVGTCRMLHTTVWLSGAQARRLSVPCSRLSTLDQVGTLHCAGPISSFLVVSDPAAAKHVLRATDNPKRPLYDKGLVAEVRLACQRR